MSLSRKRPRGLWKGRREAAALAEAKLGILPHDHLSPDLEAAATASTHSGESYDDDIDDGHTSDSSSKRRRLSGVFSETETLWQRSSSSRSLTPDLYNAPCFPSQLKYSPSPLPLMSTKHVEASPSINSRPKGHPPSTSDKEDWQNLKELFARASESFDSEDSSEALPLLRAVIRQCHRFLLAHPDPSVVYSDLHSHSRPHSPEPATPSDDKSVRSWEHLDYFSTLHLHHHHVHRPTKSANSGEMPDLPTAFHAIFGTALFMMGTLIAQDKSLALPDEPNTASTYWLAALDVFETGENLPSVLAAGSPEDWRMCISWGRTLVCLADEKVTAGMRKDRPLSSSKPPSYTPQAGAFNGWCAYQPSAGPFSPIEPRWPPQSPFHAIAAARPPVTRRMSLYSASANDVMVLAMDQFSRGIFHMPHPHYAHTHNPTTIMMEPQWTHGTGFSSAFHSRRHSTSLSPPPGGPTLGFSRPKELFTVASEVLGVAERMTRAGQRAHWAAQADSLFNQMKMEADMGEWRVAVNGARGRSWLVIGEAKAEEIENVLERGEDSVLATPDAVDAREALSTSITFFERAKGSATSKNVDTEDLSPLFAEALLTLANLTPDENKREELYARAQAESGDVELELEPPVILQTPPTAVSSPVIDVKLNTNKRSYSDMSISTAVELPPLPTHKIRNSSPSSDSGRVHVRRREDSSTMMDES